MGSVPRWHCRCGHVGVAPSRAVEVGSGWPVDAYGAARQGKGGVVPLPAHGAARPMRKGVPGWRAPVAEVGGGAVEAVTGGDGVVLRWGRAAVACQVGRRGGGSGAELALASWQSRWW
ncbi:hypothetical protein EDB89DRAFT_1903633 [Lactarius sanguifluus]|nr:hypothetical protein EDB89DRAFT_1903633 [Lactarius sanguifluus]